MILAEINLWAVELAIVFSIPLIFGGYFYLRYYKLSRQASGVGVEVSVNELFQMGTRKTDVNQVVTCTVKLAQADCPVPMSELEVAYLAGANLSLLTDMYVESRRAGRDLAFSDLLTSELAGDFSNQHPV